MCTHFHWISKSRGKKINYTMHEMPLYCCYSRTLSLTSWALSVCTFPWTQVCSIHRVQFIRIVIIQWIKYVCVFCMCSRCRRTRTISCPLSPNKKAHNDIYIIWQWILQFESAAFEPHFFHPFWTSPCVSFMIECALLDNRKIRPERIDCDGFSLHIEFSLSIFFH